MFVSRVGFLSTGIESAIPPRLTTHAVSLIAQAYTHNSLHLGVKPLKNNELLNTEYEIILNCFGDLSQSL